MSKTSCWLSNKWNQSKKPPELPLEERSNVHKDILPLCPTHCRRNSHGHRNWCVPFQMLITSWVDLRARAMGFQIPICLLPHP